MNTLLNILLIPVVTIWALPLVSDLVSMIKVALGSRGRPPLPASAERQRILILVPAHNESGQIQACVLSILRMTGTTSGEVRLVVIADNCDDNTAHEARFAGADVWERTEPDLRGKPRAIQWALDRCDLTETDAVVIVDADAEVKPDFARQLLDSGPLRERAVQTYNALQDEEGSWANMLGGLLGRSKYEGQYQLRALAGLNAPLTGNGMCVGTGVLKRCGWAADALTENWEMYAYFTLAGERIDMVTAARVESMEPASVAESSVRRQRWQAGKWRVARDYTGQLLRTTRIGLHQRVDLLAELLSVGPVAHAGIAFTLGVGLLAFASTVTTAALGTVLLFSPLPTILWTAYAIIRHPHPGKVVMGMMRLPLYLVWRITVIVRAVPTYLNGAWQRSPRPEDDP